MKQWCRRLVSSALLLAMVQPQAALAQTAAAPNSTASNTVEVPPARTLILPRDTPVEMMVMAEVSTKEHGEGHRFKLRTTKALIVDGQIVVPPNALAWGEVTSAEKSGSVGKGGRLSARLLHLEHAGRTIRLEGDTSTKSRNQTGTVVAAVVGLGLLGLLARGNNAKLKAGELMTGFIGEDTGFDVPAAAAAAALPAG